jgi:DNA invertase Pin-like site-specific DNA recombinase
VSRSVGPRLRVDGYVRVSRVGRRKGPRFISPAVQEEDIRRWAGRNGAMVLTVFEELDESGLRADRPLLEAAVQRVEGGLSQGIVVSKLDRFGRSLLHGLKMVERIRAAGGTFVSVQDGFDITTDTGKLILRLLLSFAEWDVDRMRSSWEVAQAKAIERGVYPGKQTPLGYRRTKTGRLLPNPATAPVVAEVFRLRATGRSLAQIALFIESQGVLTSGGNRGWTHSSVGCVVHHRVYLGEVHWASYRNAHAHAPLTDPSTWEAAQHPNPWPAPPSGCGEHLLRGGLVRCASCGMSLRWYEDSLRSIYACVGRSARGRCPGPAAIRADVLEAYVETVVLALLRRRGRPAIATGEQADEKLAAADAALSRYRDSDTLPRILGDERFNAGLLVRVERVRDARLQIAALREQAAVHDLPPAAALEASWPHMSRAARREIIKGVLDGVFVAPGRGAFTDRVFLCPAGTGPRMASAKTGGKAIAPGPFKPNRSTITGTWGRALYAWPRERIQAELTAFTRDRTVWPSPQEFRDAGLHTLRLQIRFSAGERVWAHHLGLDLADPPREEVWTEPRIKAALTLYVPSKQRWPTRPDFAADRLLPLLEVMTSTGGQRRWRSEYPFTRPG